MDFEWIKGVNYLSKQTWEGWISLRWLCTENLKHTNRGREELLACRRWAPGGAICRGGQPAWADRPGWLRASPGTSFLQRDDLPFVTFVPACSTSCTAQTLSSTPLLALLVLPLDAFALSHVHAPLLHMPSWISCKTILAAPHACPLHVVLMKVLERASNDASWCMHDLLN
jgi:hypothetical protein